MWIYLGIMNQALGIPMLNQTVPFIEYKAVYLHRHPYPFSFGIRYPSRWDGYIDFTRCFGFPTYGSLPSRNRKSEFIYPGQLSGAGCFFSV